MRDKELYLVLGLVAVVGVAYLLSRQKEEPGVGGVPSASIVGFGVEGGSPPYQGELVDLIPTIKNTSPTPYTYEVVILLGELNILGAWTTDPTTNRGVVYPGGNDGACSSAEYFQGNQQKEIRISYWIPTLANVKNYDVWVMVFHESKRIAEKKFLDAFPVETSAPGASAISFRYAYPVEPL